MYRPDHNRSYSREQLLRKKTHLTFQGYNFIALTGGDKCNCGNGGYDKYGPASNCNLPCEGRKRQNCGGDNALRVFNTQG